jgi:hypothetical protein
VRKITHWLHEDEYYDLREGKEIQEGAEDRVISELRSSNGERHAAFGACRALIE